MQQCSKITNHLLPYKRSVRMPAQIRCSSWYIAVRAPRLSCFSTHSRGMNQDPSLLFYSTPADIQGRECKTRHEYLSHEERKRSRKFSVRSLKVENFLITISRLLPQTICIFAESSYMATKMNVQWRSPIEHEVIASYQLELRTRPWLNYGLVAMLNPFWESPWLLPLPLELQQPLMMASLPSP